MSKLAKAYVLGQPFQSHKAANRMTAAINAHSRRLRDALEAAANALEITAEWVGSDEQLKGTADGIRYDAQKARAALKLEDVK